MARQDSSVATLSELRRRTDGDAADAGRCPAQLRAPGRRGAGGVRRGGRRRLDGGHRPARPASASARSTGTSRSGSTWSRRSTATTSTSWSRRSTEAVARARAVAGGRGLARGVRPLRAGQEARSSTSCTRRSRRTPNSGSASRERIDACDGPRRHAGPRRRASSGPTWTARPDAAGRPDVHQRHAVRGSERAAARHDPRRPPPAGVARAARSRPERQTPTIRSDMSSDVEAQVGAGFAGHGGGGLDRGARRASLRSLEVDEVPEALIGLGERLVLAGRSRR